MSIIYQKSNITLCRNYNINMILRNASSVAIQNLKKHLSKEIDDINAAGTYKNERVITSKQAASIKVAGQNKDLLNFCANNYLGLSVS
jgi:hypothetical protein